MARSKSSWKNDKFDRENRLTKLSREKKQPNIEDEEDEDFLHKYIEQRSRRNPKFKQMLDEAREQLRENGKFDDDEQQGRDS